MDMIGHYHKFMYLEFARTHVGTQNIDEEIGHAFGLEHSYTAAGSRADKKRAREIVSGSGAGVP